MLKGSNNSFVASLFEGFELDLPGKKKKTVLAKFKVLQVNYFNKHLHANLYNTKLIYKRASLKCIVTVVIGPGFPLTLKVWENLEK